MKRKEFCPLQKNIGRCWEISDGITINTRIPGLLLK